MKAMVLHQLAPIQQGSTPLVLEEREVPVPASGEILIRVRACGVCHTELDEIEGRLAPPKLPVIPGHQVVGEVYERGPNTNHHKIGARVGVGWIHHSDGSKLENLSTQFAGTGCHVDGGYAEYMTVPEAYAAPIPDAFDDLSAAPLLCAGAIGYRALSLCKLENGQPLGLMGFGGSAHLVLQMAQYLYPDSPIYVFARAAQTRTFADDLGAAWSGDTEDTPPSLCHAIIDTTPAWLPVVAALQHLVPGGRLVINAIRKEPGDQQALLGLSYHDHLWMEREIKSVANITMRDITEFLPLADRAGIRPAVTAYDLVDANRALIALKFEPTIGALALQI